MGHILPFTTSVPRADMAHPLQHSVLLSLETTSDSPSAHAGTTR